MYSKLIIFLFSITVFSFILLGNWLFVNDKIDNRIVLIWIFIFPFNYLSIFRIKRTKIVIYASSILLILIGLSLLNLRKKINMNSKGTTVCQKDGIKIKEGSWNAFLDSGSIFYAFYQSKSYPFLEKIAYQRAITNRHYHFYEHSVEIINKQRIAITYFDKYHSKEWETDTLDLK